MVWLWYFIGQIFGGVELNLAFLDLLSSADLGDELPLDLQQEQILSEPKYSTCSVVRETGPELN